MAEVTPQARVRLLSAGTGRSVDINENITVAELRKLAELSDDVTLHFNGEEVTNEDDVVLSDGDTVVGSPKKISHG